jgi:hypothetical protein
MVTSYNLIFFWYSKHKKILTQLIPNMCERWYMGAITIQRTKQGVGLQNKIKIG